MDTEQRYQIKKYLDIFLRRKKFILFTVLVALVVGLFHYLNTPKVYKASSLIMYQTSINPTKLSPDMKERFEEIVSTVSQQVTSRTNLEEVIKQFNLYPKRRQNQPMEDVVTFMRDQDIEIKPQKIGDLFVVAYQGKDPKTVMQVANALAAKFIEENLRFREERVSEASAYIKDELSMSKETLDRKEAAMRDYKLQHYNEMPDKLQSNISRLNFLQGQDNTIQTNLQDLERTRALIQEQINLRRETLDQLSLGDGTDVPPKTLEQMQATLDSLLLQYTDQHPDVKRLQKKIDKMTGKSDPSSDNDDADIPVIKPDTEKTPTGTSVPHPKADQPVEPASLPRLQDKQLQQLESQLQDIEYNVERLLQNRKEVHAEIEKYRAWVEVTPTREAEWAALTRDYGQLENHYQLLVSRKLEANAAESLERRQKGSQFRVVDPAHYPEKPFQPDFIKIMLLSLALGFGVGGALVLGHELLDDTYRDAYELETDIKLPVVTSIPVIYIHKEAKWIRLRSVIWVSAISFSYMVLAVALLVLYKKGLIII